ncbi:tol-pal system YbgF family protein [Ideonella dechloratans]|uniref:tol-pal system YbgF family protein n=1 Tax=Ideonella dechloratans TaxID=36863 RepID=UPI0035AF6A2C
MTHPSSSAPRRPGPLLATLLVAGQLWAGLGLAGPARAASDPPEPEHVVRAPHYGEVLFHFHQDQTFTALTSLMVSQQFDRLGVHADEAEVLRGGLLLSYGMHREAGQVFERLIDHGATPEVRNRAWYYLARVRYTRGEPQAAEAALAHIQGELPGALDDDRRLLQAQVKLALAQPALAAEALTPLASADKPRPPAPAPVDEDNPPPRPGLLARLTSLVLAPFSGPDPLAATDADARLFARYNLGIALIRQGDAAGGTRWLDELGQMPAANEEQRALRDQANLALGYAALQREAPEQARQYLERIRLKGPSSDKALLGYGWAALGLKQPKLALVSWTELAQRDPSQPAVQEARLAVSYALAELGADTQARDGYQSALGSYQDEDQRLGEAIAALDDPAWLDELLARNPGVEMAWFRDAEDVPHLPHLRLLAPALAGHAFQESFKTWRDLRFLQDNLAAWQETLAVYRTMLDERRKAFLERLPDVASQRQQLDPAALLPRQQQLDGELAQAEADADGRAFADAAQRALLQRADRARDTLARLQAAPASPDAPAATLQDAAERLRVLQGLLAWDLSQTYPERRWAARKALGDSAQGLQQAQAARQALDQAARDEAQRFVQFQQRIDELSRRIQALQAPLATASAQQAQALSRLAQDGLRQQQERLAGYAQQARYALAQLLDRGRDASTEPEHAPTP